MYYPDDVIAEVRDRNDIVDVISAYVSLKKQGNSYVGLCPFHTEKTPSFAVTPSKQMFYCFGCHKGGNVFTFIQEYENTSFTEALQMLAERAGITLPEQTLSQEQKSIREALLEINKLAAGYYYYQLRTPSGKVGMDYFTRRGLSEETMKSFGLGYASQNGRALYQYLKSKNFSDELLIKSGLFSFDEKRGAYDKFWNRVIFPIMDINNHVIGFGGRVMGDAKPKYLNSPENEVFNKRRNLYGMHIARRSREKRLILCEGYMDVIAMHQAGFNNAVASLGTALTEEHANLLRRYTNEVILSYDSDAAGVAAARRAIPMLKAEGLSVRILHLEPYKDPDEFIKAQGAEALRKRIDEAQNSFMFEIQVIKRDFDLSDPEGRTRYQIAAAEKIASLELEAERDNYMPLVAQECMMNQDALRQLVRHALARGVVPEKYIQPRQPRDAYAENPYAKNPYAQEMQGQESASRERGYAEYGSRAGGRRKGRQGESDGILTSERLLLTWLTEYPGFYAALQEYVQPEDFSLPLYRETASILYEQAAAGQINEAALIDRIADEEDKKKAASLLHTKVDTDDRDELLQSMRESIRKVAEEAAKRRMQAGEARDLKKVLELKKKSEKIRTLKIDLHRRED